jgi:hypothetical protein
MMLQRSMCVAPGGAHRWLSPVAGAWVLAAGVAGYTVHVQGMQWTPSSHAMHLCKRRTCASNEISAPSALAGRTPCCWSVAAPPYPRPHGCIATTSGYCSRSEIHELVRT